MLRKDTRVVRHRLYSDLSTLSAMRSAKNQDSSLWSHLNRLSPDDHAKMVLFPLLATIGVISLSVAESFTDALFTSSVSFLLAGVLGYQAYTAWDAANGGTEKLNS